MSYVLVTASSGGLGLEIVKQLDSLNYKLIVTSRNDDSLAEVEKSLSNSKNHKFIKVDYENDEELKVFLQNLQNIECVVHNLGVKIKGDSHPIDEDILKRSINLNFTIANKINNVLVKTKELKKIIHIGSVASLHAKASPCYTLSKGLIDTYVKNISNEYIKKGVIICGVQPGIMAHNGSEWDKKKVLEFQKYENTKNSQPLKRFLMPKDIVEYILMLIEIKSMAFSGSMLKLDANDY
jgi:short-subunit dehydrogenase